MMPDKFTDDDGTGIVVHTKEGVTFTGGDKRGEAKAKAARARGRQPAMKQGRTVHSTVQLKN